MIAVIAIAITVLPGLDLVRRRLMRADRPAAVCAALALDAVTLPAGS